MKRIISLLRTATLRDSLISFLGLGVTAGFGFVFTIVMARTLGPGQYGVFSSVTALSSIVYSLGDLGISSALINFIPKIKDKRHLLIDTSFWFQLAVGIIILLIFAVFSFFNNRIIPNSLSYYLILAGVLSFNYLLIGFSQGVFTAERRFWTFSLSQIIDATIKIIIVLLLLSLSKLSIGTALIANVISTFIALIITFSKDLFQIKYEFDKHIFTKLFIFAKWIAVSRVFSVLFSKIDIILLNLMSTSYNAGIFAAASRVTLLFALLVASLNSVINPRFSEFDKKSKVLVYIKKLTLFIGGIGLLMLVCTILARPIILIAFGNKYLPAIPVFQYMTIAMIPFLFSLITTPAIIYTYNKPDFYAKMTAVQVVSIVIIETILIPKISYFAPVIALGVTNLAILAVTLLKLKQLLDEDKR